MVWSPVIVSIYLSIYIYMYLSIYLFILIYIYVSIYLSIYLSIYRSSTSSWLPHHWKLGSWSELSQWVYLILRAIPHVSSLPWKATDKQTRIPFPTSWSTGKSYKCTKTLAEDRIRTDLTSVLFFLFKKNSYILTGHRTQVYCYVRIGGIQLRPTHSSEFSFSAFLLVHFY